MTTATIDFWHVQNGRLEFRPHPGQYKALNCPARFILVLAGTQSGKTVLGPLWLLQEMQRRGVGDYLVVAPSFPLLDKKVLPETIAFFERTLKLGEYKAGRKVMEMHDGSTIFFGHAADPDSLESATAKAAWLDECGQDGFRLASWEAIQRRLAVHQGRVLMTTTPYNLGWLKSQVYDRWRAGDVDYKVIQFRSIENPAFPRAEFERARRTLPGWKFRMFYEGEFTRPAGLIYDCLTDANIIKPFAIPESWRRVGGMDFGGINTAAVLLVQSPGGAIYLTDEYHRGGLTAQGHKANLEAWGCYSWMGGSKSEEQWRNEFRQAGMPMEAPRVTEVEVGINRVYGLLKQRKLMIFDTAIHTIDQLGSYRRVLDANGDPTEAISDKDTYHYLDAVRYGVQYFTDGGFTII